MKQIFQILASAALALLITNGLGGCDDTGKSAVAPTPVNEVDTMLNGYEAVGKECRRMAKKMREGDVSVTALYISLGHEFRDWPAKHAPLWAKMTPAQAQRAAAITAQTTPDLPK
jgi:hypothetical protein